jgi:hypothetical protein
MTLDEDDKKDLAAYRLDKAEALLADAKLSREFIKPGLLSKEMGEIFRSLQARRVDSDYGDYV